MIAADRKRIELALENEHRTSQRQALLKQLWRLSRLLSQSEQADSENGAQSIDREAESRAEPDRSSCIRKSGR